MSHLQTVVDELQGYLNPGSIVLVKPGENGYYRVYIKTQYKKRLVDITLDPERTIYTLIAWESGK